MILAFQKQMTQHWVKVARIVKELVGKRAGGPNAILPFVDFLLNVNLPISVMLLPLIHSKVRASV